MIWRIILWGSLIWLPYLMYRVLGGEAKFTKNIVVGVTLPIRGARGRGGLPAARKIQKGVGHSLRRADRRGRAVRVIRSVSLSMTLYLTWADVCIVIPYTVPALQPRPEAHQAQPRLGGGARRHAHG
ncbi:MAG: hypothetical protein V8S72_00785 [Oscillospiraceae bacterium]